MELKYLLLGQWLDDGFQMYTEAYDYTGPLAAFVYKYLDFIFGRSAFVHHAFSTLLIIIQAGIFNQLLLKNKAYNESNYLPAFFYMILMVSMPDFMALSPQLMSLTFILLALKNVLRRIDNQATDELFLNSGIAIGIATMVHLPSAVFFLVFLFSLILFSTAVTRRLLLYLFGFFLIFGLTYLFYYWTGDHYRFVESFVLENLLMESTEMLSTQELLLLSSGFLCAFLLAVFKTLSSARLTNFQQKIQQVIWLMLFGTIGCFLLSNEGTGLELVFMVPVIAYFLAHYFLLLRKRIWQNLMPALIIFGLLVFSVFGYSKWSDSLLINPKDFQSENGMLLGTDLNYYVNSKAGTPCFNEALTLKAFEGLNYYGEASKFYEMVEKASPDDIIDDMDIADNIFNRFPTLQEKYIKVGENRYRRISN